MNSLQFIENQCNLLFKGGKLFKFQKDLIYELNCKHFNLITKSRQLGVTSILVMHALWAALFQRCHHIIIISPNLNMSINCNAILNKLISNKFVCKQNKLLTTFSNGSTIEFISSSKDLTFKSVNLVMISELSFMSNITEVLSYANSVVSHNGKIVITGMPNKFNDEFHQLYKQVLYKNNKFKSLILPWNLHPEHNQEWFNTTTSNLSNSVISKEYWCDFGDK